MVVEQLLTLPEIIHFEGIDFRLSLTLSGGRGCQLFYEIFVVYDDSPHLDLYNEKRCWSNSFMKGNKCTFLCGEQYNYSDEELLETIEVVRDWLFKNKLLVCE